jgi:SAM-dependent methyltransferase
MTTLILGHTYRMNNKDIDIRCSPIDIELWLYKPFTCVDYLCNPDDTDIVYDLYRSVDYRFCEKGIKYDGFWVWKFAEDESYDIIIDCMGSIKWCVNRTNYKHDKELLDTIKRILKPNGKFYSYFGIYTKLANSKLSFEAKKLNGYKYV